MKTKEQIFESQVKEEVAMKTEEQIFENSAKAERMMQLGNSLREKIWEDFFSSNVCREVQGVFLLRDFLYILRDALVGAYSFEKHLTQAKEDKKNIYFMPSDFKHLLYATQIYFDVYEHFVKVLYTPEYIEQFRELRELVQDLKKEIEEKHAYWLEWRFW